MIERIKMNSIGLRKSGRASLISIPQNNNLHKNTGLYAQPCCNAISSSSSTFWAIELAYNQGCNCRVMPLHTLNLQIDGEMQVYRICKTLWSSKLIKLQTDQKRSAIKQKNPF